MYLPWRPGSLDPALGNATRCDNGPIRIGIRLWTHQSERHTHTPVSMACVCPRQFSDVPIPNYVWCVLWYLCFPLIWVYHSVRIYCCGCMCSYFVTCCSKTWLACGKACCCCLMNCGCCLRIKCCICLPYEDRKSFPADASSIGDWNDLDAAGIGEHRNSL